MSGTTAFELSRADLHDTRFAEEDLLTPGEGEAILAVESFGMTANNVTYAVFGEAMNYWDFFPASGPEWGRLPVWGYGRVVSSSNPGLEEGARYYGYYPAATHLRVLPDKLEGHGFVDAAAHRAPLPSAYQGYRSVGADPAYHPDREDEQIIFWPLFYTSFLVDDFFADEGLFRANTVALSSASSKTALIAAYLLAQRDGVELVGLTSSRNADWVRGLHIYKEVLTYDEVGLLPESGLIYADFSGDADLRAAIHEHAGDGLAHSAVIGATHWDDLAGEARDLPGPKPTFFFAPDRIRKRGEDWGAPELEKRVAGAWHPFAEWSGDWLEIQHGEGTDALEKTWLSVLDGEIGPEAGPVVSLTQEPGPAR